MTLTLEEGFGERKWRFGGIRWRSNKGVGLDSVKYAAGRIDPEVKFTDEACEMLIKVPRPFLNMVLKGCVAWAKENNVALITEKEMQTNR